MEGSFESPLEVLEGETCSALVGLLGQLADLVDHSAVVFAGLHEQVFAQCILSTGTVTLSCLQATYDTAARLISWNPMCSGIFPALKILGLSTEI